MFNIAWGIILAVFWLIGIVVAYLIIEDWFSYHSTKRKEEKEYNAERDRKIAEQEKRLMEKWEL